MTKLARLPGFDRTAAAEPAAGHAPRLRTRYYAFLSYSHQDRELAEWLHRELETFRVPSAIAGKLTANGVVPRRLTPIFRDQHDLSAVDDLAVEIEAALAASQFLLVLCSPTAAKSRWTNLEIESFKRTRPEGCVLAAVAAGEPFASDMAGREDEECFPPALRYKYDRRGHRTQKRAEPLAADFRETGEGRRLALLKLVAGMLGVGLDELVQREQTRRHRQLAFLAAGSLAGMAVTSTLAVTAIHARDAAREQRRQAEGLVAFMLGDLKDKLDPIGKLDVLDGVGSRVLDYYSKQDTKQLSDVGLAQRSKALTLMGQIARDRGELDRGDALYRQAYAGTAEEVARDPADPQRLYDHAQNAFYLSDIAFRRGDLAAYVASSREYKRLADRMVELDPNNMKWRMELNYAGFNLGIALYDRRQFGAAIQQFSGALGTIEALAAADPSNDTYKTGVIDALAWVADAQEANGRIADAIESSKRQIALLQRALPQEGAEGGFRLVPAYRRLGILLAETGNSKLALDQIHASVAQADKLLAIDPTNTKWLESAQRSRLILARELFSQGKAAEAAAQVQPVCSTYKKLVAKDRSVVPHSTGLRDCLILQARIAARSGQNGTAGALAAEALRTANSVKTLDPADARFGVAEALRVLGDIRRSGGDSVGGQTAWTDALAAVPEGIAEKPSEAAEHALILERLGRSAEAARLKSRLTEQGYVQATFR
jgi:tetratricopeptide (TPR) repeat protein